MSNKKKISVLVIIIALSGVLVFVSASKNGGKLKELTKEEKIEDFEYMYNIIKDNYVYFYDGEGITEEDWIKSKDNLKKAIIKTTNNLEFYNIMSNIFYNHLKWLHTSIVDPVYYNDVINAINYNKDYHFSYKKIFEKARKKYEGWTELLKEAYQGKYNVKNSSITMMTRSRENIRTEILEKDKIAYLKINSFAIDYDQNYKIFEKEKKEIIGFLKSVKDYPYLIIDISDNGGGDPTYWRESIVFPLSFENIDNFKYSEFYVLRGGDYSMEYLKKDNQDIYKNKIEYLDFYESLPKKIKKNFKYYRMSKGKEGIKYTKDNETVDFKGKKFLIINENVASAATKFAQFCKESGFAKLVGTSTYYLGGSEIYASLPNSGLIMRVECELAMFPINKDGNFSVESKISPDIEVEKSKFGKYGIREKYNTKVIKELINRIDSGEFE